MIINNSAISSCRRRYYYHIPNHNHICDYIYHISSIILITVFDYCYKDSSQYGSKTLTYFTSVSPLVGITSAVESRSP